eukprot:323738_1
MSSHLHNWKELSYPTVNKKNSFILAQGCNNDCYLGIEIFHHSQPGFKIYSFNFKVNQWEEKAEFRYRKVFLKGIILNQKTGMLYVLIEYGTQLLHIELHYYKIVKHVQIPQEMFANTELDGRRSRPLSRTTTVMLDHYGLHLLYLVGSKGHLFLYHINKNIITQKHLKFYRKNAYQQIGFQVNSTDAITFIGGRHGQTVDTLNIDTFTSNVISKIPFKYDWIKSCKIFHNDTLIFGRTTKKQYVLDNELNEMNRIVELLGEKFGIWLKTNKRNLKLGTENSIFGLKKTILVTEWTKYIYSMKQNKFNKIELPMPADEDGTAATAFDIVSFGLSATIVPAILKKTCGDLLTACPSDIIDQIILFTADECIYFMDSKHRKHYYIETIKIMNKLRLQ